MKKPATTAEKVVAAKKRQAAAVRALHTPPKKRAVARTTASRSGGLRPTSTRPGSARPRSGSTGRGSRGRGFALGTGRPIWVLGAVMAALALLTLPYFQKWLVQRAEIESMRSEVTQAQNDVESLKKQQERWKDDDYVRAQARARLDYVMPGEIGYAVPGATPTPQADPSSTGAADVPAGNQSWFSSVWVSAQAAGSQGEAQATTEVP
ncbi:FtsB family cell division protein [Kineosporia succinea]|uniref:Cell division protein FtsB n=1 Tax=Kineosporia succinea TaxID=84632 RepID=A0ABT9NYS5_9ACTN|nr:septum formation initiator family protein [Kineosporia succinea]MDP9825593.1 cell division protein FtsB [Kineosporia succinea]